MPILTPAPIDATPGAEVAVETGRGASVSSVDLFTLRPMGIRRLLQYMSVGGTVGHSHRVDCAALRGVRHVVVTGAGFDHRRDGYVVGREFLRRRGLSLTSRAVAIRRRLVRRFEDLRRFPEFRDPRGELAPLVSC